MSTAVLAAPPPGETALLPIDRAELLAEALDQALAGSGNGHCLRVNHLTIEDCKTVRETLVARPRATGDTRLNAHILVNRLESGDDPDGEISPDVAVELRNRKAGVLCLFVPAGEHGSAASSLGNSFAELDGRSLIKRALDMVRRRRPDISAVLKDVESAFPASAVIRPTDSDLLDFAVAIAATDPQADEDGADRRGRELWRVGLIADGGADFRGRLSGNRRAVVQLSRPRQITASLDDRIAGLKLTQGSAAQVRHALRSARLSDVRAWSQRLATMGGPTYDRWESIDDPEPTACTGVILGRFLDDNGALARGTRGLVQPGKAGSMPLAVIDEKSTLRVTWKTAPNNRKEDVPQWVIALEPADPELAGGDDLIDLPSIEKAGKDRSANLKLDLSFDAWPQYPFRVRITGLDAAGNEMESAAEGGGRIEAFSEEFLLTNDRGEEFDAVARPRSVATLAEGYLRAVVEADADLELLPAAIWNIAANTVTSSIRATPKFEIVLAFNPLLYASQRRVLDTPSSLGRLRLHSEETTRATDDAIAEIPDPTLGSTEAKAFARARAKFFKAVSEDAASIAVVETLAWTAEAVRDVVAYGRAYMAWLGAATGEELDAALGVDTLSIRIGEGSARAAVVLPTHPLRALWFAGHATLLGSWTDRLAELRKPARPRAVDLAALHGLEASNCPAFALPGDTREPYIFYANLDPGNGLCMPAATPDPALLVVDVKRVLGIDTAAATEDGRQAARLAWYLESFDETHPYSDPLDLALVNPGDGQLLDDALDRWERDRAALARKRGDDDEDVLSTLPQLSLTAYRNERRSIPTATATTLTGLARRRRQESDRLIRTESDHLRPALSIRMRTDEDMVGDHRAADHHLTIVQNVAHPTPIAEDSGSDGPAAESFALHGLIARFTPSFVAGPEGVRWTYRLAGSKPRPHPTQKNLAETLVEVHNAVTTATGRLLAARAGSVPADPASSIGVLSVSLDDRTVRLLERVHHASDWVLTVDRFLGVDYYDSPSDPTLSGISRKFVLDAAPEFNDGLSHRIIVTTTSRHEVADILRRQMEQFGFSTIDESVGKLLTLLKMVSGRLALDALRGETRAAAAVALAAVVSHLRDEGRLDGAILVPVDSHIGLLEPEAEAAAEAGRQRCDLLLARPGKGRIDVTLIEVKWRASLTNGEAAALTEDMAAQMRATGSVLHDRYFNADRVDGGLRRAALVHVLRFYLDRAVRHGLIPAESRSTFQALLAGVEHETTQLRTRHEGFVIVLKSAPERRTFTLDDETMVRIMTVAEIAGGEQLRPTPSLQPAASVDAVDDSASSQQVDNAPASVHDPPIESETVDHKGADVAATDLDQSTAGTGMDTTTLAPSDFPQDVILGDTDHGDPVIWSPRVAGSPHLFILGIPGQGKSKTIERILTELSESGTPAIVFDFHGPLADPNGPYARLARPIVLDAANGLPFSPLDCDPRGSGLEIMQHAQSVAEILRHVFALGDIQQDVVYTCLRDLYFKRGYADVDDDGPHPSPPTVRDLGKALERREKDQQARNVVARCRHFFDFDLFSDERVPGADFDALLRQGVVVGLHRLGGLELPLAVSAFLLRRIYLDMIGWGEADRIRLVIVLDEAHRLANDVTLPKIMKEGRKYGVAVVSASQGLSDFHPDVVGNAGTKVSFRVNHPDSRKVAGFFRPRGGQEVAPILERLHVGQALVETPDMDGARRTNMRLPRSMDAELTSSERS